MSLLAPTTRALIWKEWRENSVRLALALLVSTVIAASLPLMMNHEWPSVHAWGQIIAVMAAGVLLGVRLADERGGKTESTLRSLPCRRRPIAAIKFSVGLFSLIIVCLLAALLAFPIAWMAGNPAIAAPDDVFYAAHPSMFLVCLLSFALPSYLWAAAAASTANSEADALLRCMILAGLWWIALAATPWITAIAGPRGDGPIRTIVFGLSPAGGLTALGQSYRCRPWETEYGVVLATGCFVMTLAGLVLWTLSHLHRLASAPRTTDAAVIAPTKPQSLPRPIRGTGRAWLMGVTRAPIRITLALLILLAIPLIFSYCIQRQLGHYQYARLYVMNGSPESFWTIASVLHAGFLALWLIGREQENRLPWFWRALPRRVSQWFCIRVGYAIGLLAIPAFGVAILDSALLLLDAHLTFSARYPPSTPALSVFYTAVHRFPVFMLSRMIPLTTPFAAGVAAFAVAVLAIAWLRRPVTAVFAGTLLTLAIFILPDCGDVWALLPRWNPFTFHHTQRWLDGTHPRFLILCAVLTAVSIPLALRSFQRHVA